MEQDRDLWSGELDEYSFDDLLADADTTADMAGGAEYRAGESDSAEDVFRYRHPATNRISRVHFEAERAREAFGMPVTFAEFEIRTMTVQPIHHAALPLAIVAKLQEMFSEEDEPLDIETLDCALVGLSRYHFDGHGGFTLNERSHFDVDEVPLLVLADGSVIVLDEGLEEALVGEETAVKADPPSSEQLKQAATWLEILREKYTTARNPVV